MYSSSPKLAIDVWWSRSEWSARLLPVLLLATVALFGVPILCERTPSQSEPSQLHANTTVPARERRHVYRAHQVASRITPAAGVAVAAPLAEPQSQNVNGPAESVAGVEPTFTRDTPSVAGSRGIWSSRLQLPPAMRLASRGAHGDEVSAALAREALLPTTSLQLSLPDGAWPALDVDLDSPLLRELQVRLGVPLRDRGQALIVSGRRARFDLLQARSGDATARGYFARTARGPTGTLLFSTPYANLDLSVVSGDVQVRVLWGQDLLSWDKRTPGTAR